MSEGNNHINYSAADIEKYQRGQLSAAAMHAMEKAALDDPFLADAMDGYGDDGKAAAPLNIKSDIAELHERLADRVKEKQNKAPVIQFAWWKVAAVLFVFLGAAFFYVVVKSKQDASGMVAVNNSRQDAPVYNKADSAATASRVPLTDTLHDVAVLQHYRPAPAAHQPSFFKPADKKPAAAAPVAVNSDAAGKISKEPERESDKADTMAVRKDIAATAPAEQKKDIAKNDDGELNQKIEGIASGVARSNSRALPGRTVSFSNTFNGMVVDQSNQPVANARVQIPHLNIATSTNSQGYFSFKAPDTALNVSVASVGFETQHLDLTTNNIENQNNIIQLKPSLLSLDEVVVTGYGTHKKQDLKKSKDVVIHILDAEPVVSWNEYNVYLLKNKRLTDSTKDIHGEVVVAFIVDNKGSLKNFRVEKSLTEQTDAEAIRLVKEGPGWKLLKGRKAKASVVVKF